MNYKTHGRKAFNAVSKKHGLPIRFSRRRYPGQTYTWVSVLYYEMWHELGDPWPCIRPKDTEIDDAIEYLISHLDRPEVAT